MKTQTSMKPQMVMLSELLRDIVTVSSNDCEIRSITLDSREVTKGCLFVALKGNQQHGLSYAQLAEEQGAVAIVWESDSDGASPVEMQIPCVEIAGLRSHLGLIADRFYQSPSSSLQLVGITGTDGKTSVSHFMAQAIDQCAVIGTIGLGKLDALKKATHTTPDVLSVHKNLAEMKEDGITTIAMEVSSHALDQGRVNNVAFDVAVLTNLSRDHLDYHKTEKAYAEAKEKLFYWESLKGIVVNLDDVFGQKILKTRGGVLRVIGYGIGNTQDYPVGALVASNESFDVSGIKAQVSFENIMAELSVSVLGRFNLSNLLAALGAMLSMGDSLESAVKKLSNVQTVAGRMEKISDIGFLTVVDFAHTPNALKSVLQALREHLDNEQASKLICVFGCGGDRDAGKRPLMASIAEKYADVVIVTDDNPRTESPQKIMTDIVAGFLKPQSVMIEHDRATAIRMALKKARNGDVVLIAGKGHECEQILATGSVSFNDAEQAQKFLQEFAA